MTLEARKATHEQLRRHNLLMLLRAIYRGEASSRAALAQMTGLTKPTVSNLVSELIADGLVSEGGHGPASESGGKRPRLLEFRAQARQVIGIGVDHLQVTGVLTDLAGGVVAQHRVELDPERALELIVGVVDGLRAQQDAPLLCLGIGVPGEVDASGTVRRSGLPGWNGLSVAHPLAERYGVPVHVANGTELSALAQYAFGESGRAAPARLVTLLIEHGVEVGVTLEQGAFHYGSDIGSLRPGAPGPQAEGLAEWLADGGLDYLNLGYLAANGDAGALAALDELASRLAPVVSWIVGLLRPDRLSLAGPVTDLGERFLPRLGVALREWLPADEIDGVDVTLANSRLSGALGAVALALKKELALI